MSRRRLVFVAAAVVAAGACAALFQGVRRPAVAHAAADLGAPLRELSPVSAGRCTVSWTPANGLSLRWDGVPVVRKSTLYIVKAGWSGLLLDQRTVPVRVTPWNEDAATGAKVAQVTLENNDALAAYTFTLANDGRTFAVDLAYRLKRDVPAEIEYGAAYLSGPVLQGASYTAAGHMENAWEGISGPISVLPPSAGRMQEQNRLAPPFEVLSLATRLGPISVRYEGNARRPVIFDARSDPQGWAQEFPVFWMGIGSPPAPVTFADGERRATLTFAFEVPATATPTHNTKAEQLGRDAAQPSLVPVSDARAPYVPPVPLVIPRPKQMIVRGEPFRLTPQTRIVVPDGATQADKQPAEILRKDVRERFGLDLPLVRARSVVQSESVIVIGVIGDINDAGQAIRNTLLARLQAREQIGPPPVRPEGYRVFVSPRAVLVAGRDRRGALWGVQTVRQLLAPDPKGLSDGGVIVRPAQITDWPTLGIRAVHLFHGKNALPFHKALIERVFSRYKLNALVLQVEQLRWDADPAIAPMWAGSKADVREEIAFARARGLTTYPLVQGMGHMEWLFSNKRNLAFAEDPQTPYALNVTDPKALAHLGKIMAEADALFAAPAFHVGLDEVTMRGRFPHRSAPRTFADLFVTGATHWQGFFVKRDKPIWIWADMLLHKSEAVPSFGTASTPEDAARLRRELPKNIVLVDWQYGAHQRFPSLKLLKDAGFPVMAATWFNPVNIQNFSREAANVGALGAIQTTWAGYESNAAVLETEQRKQFSAMILAADYFWNGGDGPVPDALPYNADEVFTQAMNETSAEQQQEATRVRAGWLFDLAPFATRPADDWLGYNGEMGLTGLPPASAPGERLRDGIRYRGAATNGGVLLLAGKLNPPGASAQPTSVTVPLSDIAAREVNLLLATSHRADKGTVVGSVTVTIADGRTQTTPLVYGKNIAAVDDLAATPDAPVVWQGAFSARGSDSAPGHHSTNQTHQAVLRRLTIRVPAPTMEGAVRSRVPLLRSLVITSENTEAAPAVFAVTLIK